MVLLNTHVIARAVRPALQRGFSCPYGAIHLPAISWGYAMFETTIDLSKKIGYDI
jgi:hypothetical protein